MKRGALVVAAGFLSVSAFAAAEATSDCAFIYVDTAESSFWRTATNNTISISVDYPAGATSAALAVTGAGYSKTYENVPEGLYDLALPAAMSPETENVYDLTLTFDAGDPVSAKVAVIAGATDGASGTARCVEKTTSRKWSKVSPEHAVLPVPFGATVLTVNGEAVDPGLDGARGWTVLSPVAIGSEYVLSLETGSGEFASADLVGAGGGLIMLLR